MRTIQVKAQADLLIVLIAVECSKTWDMCYNKVLLLYRCNPEHHKVYLRSEPKATTPGATSDIEAIVRESGLKPANCSLLLTQFLAATQLLVCIDLEKGLHLNG